MRHTRTTHSLWTGYDEGNFISYCSLVMFREVFFVSKAHRKPENCGAKSCECMISVHRVACCWSRSEQ